MLARVSSKLERGLLVAVAIVVLIGAAYALLRHLRGAERGHDEVISLVDEVRPEFPPLAEGEGAVLFAGDTLLGLGAGRVMAREGASAPLQWLTPVFRSAGAAAIVINHEGPLTERRRTPGPNGIKHGYWAAPATARVLAEAGVTHASLANNHALDQGLPGLRDTVQHLVQAGVTPFGWGERVDDAMAPTVVEVAGVTVALIGMLHPWPKYWHADWAATDDRPGLLMLRKPRVEEAVARARALADVVVVYGHTGREYQPLHSSQRTEADWAAAAGADAFVGHHSHVAQGWSLHEGMPTIWGLGNAAFGSAGRFDRDDGYGLLARMVVADGHIDRFELLVIETSPDLTGHRSRPARAPVARAVLERLALQGPTVLEIEGHVAVLRVPRR